MKIQLRRCRTCWAVVWTWTTADIDFTADPERIDAQNALTALLGGRELYRMRRSMGEPANPSPAGPDALRDLDAVMVVKEHGCPKALTWPLEPYQTPGTWNRTRKGFQAVCGPFPSVLGPSKPDAGCQVCGPPPF